MRSIFIRRATLNEHRGGIARRRAFLALRKAPLHMEAVYMPYGEEGDGFYYIEIQSLAERWLRP